jgi:hypothetical protein
MSQSYRKLCARAIGLAATAPRVIHRSAALTAPAAGVGFLLAGHTEREGGPYPIGSGSRRPAMGQLFDSLCLEALASWAVRALPTRSLRVAITPL